MALTIKKIDGTIICNVSDEEMVDFIFTHPLGTVTHRATPMGFILNNIKHTEEEKVKMGFSEKKENIR